MVLEKGGESSETETSILGGRSASDTGGPGCPVCFGSLDCLLPTCQVASKSPLLVPLPTQILHQGKPHDSALPFASLCTFSPLTSFHSINILTLPLY